MDATQPNPATVITVRLGNLRAAFSEWDRRWRENPAAFQSDVDRLLSGQTTDEYGDRAAATLLAMIDAVT